MKCLLVLAALVAVSYAAGLGAPEAADPSGPIAKEILAKAKELGKTTNVEIKEYTINSSTRYNLHQAELLVDGKKCTMSVSEEKPLKFLEGADNCILCC